MRVANNTRAEYTAAMYIRSHKPGTLGKLQCRKSPTAALTSAWKGQSSCCRLCALQRGVSKDAAWSSKHRVGSSGAGLQ